MAEKERIKIEPDLDFVQDIIDNGGESLKKCFQCGTCSVVCNLAKEGSPFPRKEMIWAQWGLKEKLACDPDVWNCFQCGDCTAYCPRGAKPGDVLGAVRKKVIESLAWPAFMGKAVANPQNLIWLIALPVLILGAIVLINGTGFMNERPIIYGHMISHIQMNVVFPLFLGIAVLAFLMGINKMIQGSTGESALSWVSRAEKPRLTQAVTDVIRDIITHKDFDECETNKWRRLAHMLVFYAFIGLLATTALAIVVLVMAEYLHNDALGHYPLSWYHPIKWLGNASAIALIAGTIIMLKERKAREADDQISTSYFDSFFIWLILLVGVTGFVAQLIRLIDGPPILGYPIYFIHLVLVFELIIYAPYTKFAHFVYRTVALILARYRELGEAQVTSEAPAAAEEEPAAA